jgi:hypothetical protein
MVARDATFDDAADAGRIAAPGGSKLDALSADGPAGAAPSWDGAAGANDVGEPAGDSRIVADRASTADAFRFPEEPLPGCVPLCLWRLFAACTRPPEETCQTEIHQKTILATCYSSGAKETYWIAEHRATEYYPDGSVCLSLEQRANPTGTLTTYRDGQGTVVAVTRDLDPNGERVEVDCEGRKTIAEMSDRCAVVSRACPANGKCPL